MSIFLFYDQPGTVPGYPGSYAHCMVRIMDGVPHIFSLPQAPHILKNPAVVSPSESESSVATDETSNQQSQKRKGSA